MIQKPVPLYIQDLSEEADPTGCYIDNDGDGLEMTTQQKESQQVQIVMILQLEHQTIPMVLKLRWSK